MVLVPALTALRRGRLASAVVPAAAIAIAGIVVAQAGGQATPRHTAVHGAHRGGRDLRRAEAGLARHGHRELASPAHRVPATAGTSSDGHGR
jgi:hypothetical protein